MTEPTSLSLEVAITEWPTDGPPRVITQPWVRPLMLGRYQRFSWDYPLIHDPTWGLRLDLADLIPADPGWLAGSISLAHINGQQIGRERPVRLYGRRSDIPTHAYFPSSAYDSAYSVALRVVSGGLTDD
jgi:hypothetical protein